jgi:hypothetical protein
MAGLDFRGCGRVVTLEVARQAKTRDDVVRGETA